jgi:hypothetical protein
LANNALGVEGDGLDADRSSTIEKISYNTSSKGLLDLARCVGFVATASTMPQTHRGANLVYVDALPFENRDHDLAAGLAPEALAQVPPSCRYF